MERTYVSEIMKCSSAVFLVKGWVHKIHDLGGVTFVLLRDKTGVIQLVLNETTKVSLRLETCIEAMGEKVNNEKVPMGIELKVSEIKVIGRTYYDSLPIEINRRTVSASLEKQLDHRSISLRRKKTRDVFRVQEEIVEAFRVYLRERGFSEVHTPKIIASSTEGGSEMFTVNYFERRAFLAQSPQFYKQMMVGAGFERVFEIGAAYRAELHNTWRHLNEYISLDVEMGFIKDENDLMELEEGFIRHLFNHLLQYCPKELEAYGVCLPEAIAIPRIPLSEVQSILFEKYGKKSPAGNIDAEGEILLSGYIRETYGSDFVFLTKYPAAKRPMYAMPDEEEPGMTRSFDLIYKGLEITTGGQRIHDYLQLKANIEKFDLIPDNFKFYLDTFKYGMPPHGGFAIGLERLTMKVLELDNIREATLLPRDIKRLEP